MLTEKQLVGICLGAVTDIRKLIDDQIVLHRDFVKAKRNVLQRFIDVVKFISKLGLA